MSSHLVVLEVQSEKFLPAASYECNQFQQVLDLLAIDLLHSGVDHFFIANIDISCQHLEGMRRFWTSTTLCKQSTFWCTIHMVTRVAT